MANDKKALMPLIVALVASLLCFCSPLPAFADVAEDDSPACEVWQQYQESSVTEYNLYKKVAEDLAYRWFMADDTKRAKIPLQSVALGSYKQLSQYAEDYDTPEEQWQAFYDDFHPSYMVRMYSLVTYEDSLSTWSVSDNYAYQHFKEWYEYFQSASSGGGTITDMSWKPVTLSHHSVVGTGWSVGVSVLNSVSIDSSGVGSISKGSGLDSIKVDTVPALTMRLDPYSYQKILETKINDEDWYNIALIQSPYATYTMIFSHGDWTFYKDNTYSYVQNVGETQLTYRYLTSPTDGVVKDTNGLFGNNDEYCCFITSAEATGQTNVAVGTWANDPIGPYWYTVMTRAEFISWSGGGGVDVDPVTPVYPEPDAPDLPTPSNPIYVDNDNTTTTADLAPILDALRIINTNIVNGFTAIEDDFTAFVEYFGEWQDSIWNELRSVNAWLERIFYKTGGGSSDGPDITIDGDGWWSWLSTIAGLLLGDLTGAVSGLAGAFDVLRGLFPFSIPWDLAALLGLFVSDPVTPVFDLPVPFGFANGTLQSASVHVDLSAWDNVMVAVRSVELAIFALGLALKTRELLKNAEVEQ